MDSHIFFFDIDGTLLYCPQGKTDLDEKTYLALKQLHASYPICIASGRPLSYIPNHLLSLEFDGMVLANGAYVSYQGTVIREDHLSDREVFYIVEYCKAHRVEYVLEGTEAYYAPYAYQMMQVFFDRFDLPKDRRADRPIDKVTKIAVICPDHEVANRFEQHFKERYRLMAHGDDSFDLYPFSQSKARGILDLVNRAGYTMKDVVAFGDGFNDMKMLGDAGLGIAMGNANPLLKAQADYVTAPVMEQGVAKALKHFGWIV